MNELPTLTVEPKQPLFVYEDQQVCRVTIETLESDGLEHYHRWEVLDCPDRLSDRLMAESGYEQASQAAAPKVAEEKPQPTPVPREDWMPEDATHCHRGYPGTVYRLVGGDVDMWSDVSAGWSETTWHPEVVLSGPPFLPLAPLPAKPEQPKGVGVRKEGVRVIGFDGVVGRISKEDHGVSAFECSYGVEADYALALITAYGNARYEQGKAEALSGLWVSVEERLPEENRLVVVAVGNSPICDPCVVDKGKWAFGFSLKAVPWQVTHWLDAPPLPEKK